MYRLPGLSHRAAEFVRDLALSEFVDLNKPVGQPKALSVGGGAAAGAGSSAPELRLWGAG